MADPIVELAGSITPAVARKVASSLEIDGSLTKALALLPTGSEVGKRLAECHGLLGSTMLASVLRGFATSGDKSGTDIRSVWSGPSFDGDGDHTTSAIAHLIDEATDDVFASTYSATVDSAFVQALWRAIARGVRTTLLIDSTVKDGQTATMLQSKLSGARFCTYVPADGKYGLQHSKIVIVDSRSAFVTSANLSTAAAERNLEAGVVIHDAAFASKMRQRFAKLRDAGVVTDL